MKNFTAEVLMMRYAQSVPSRNPTSRERPKFQLDTPCRKFVGKVQSEAARRLNHGET